MARDWSWLQKYWSYHDCWLRVLGTKPQLETRKKLGALRRRLLRAVERMLEKIDGDRDDLAQALCAYSLATSSGAKDVLRHFLHIRGEAMALAFEDDEEAPKKGR